MTRYLLGLLVAAGLIILIIVLMFGGGGKSAPKTVTKTLPSYVNSGAVVKMTIAGPVTAGQNHNEIQVTVGQNSATYDLVQGYNGNIIESKSYPNSYNGYNAFLYALNYAGFTKGNKASDLSNNTGYCPVGNTYIFELTLNGNDLERYWSTNCGGTPKTYDGNLGLTIDLFEAQIPDYGMLSAKSNI